MDRMKEPSTYAGLAALVAVFLPQFAADLPDLVSYGGAIAGGVAGLVAIFRRERASA